MNKFGIFLLVVASSACISSVAGGTCEKDVKIFFKDNNFIDMKDDCVRRTEEQIKMEVSAAMKYLSMASYFTRDNVNRPGFAKFFFDAASEEREHAHKLIEYLAMRGRYLTDVSGSPSKFQPDIAALVKEAEHPDALKGVKLAQLETTDTSTTSGLIALQNALKMEVAVTKSIRELIEKCEDGFNHYHFVDVLTGDFLDEQYKGQRELAGKISTLGKMVQGKGAQLGEFLFDKQLL